MSLSVGYEAWYGKNICSRCVIGESVKYHSRRGFLVPGNTTLWLGGTDIGACRHNLQGGRLSHTRKCIVCGKDTGLYRKRPWTGQHTILEPMLYRQPQSIFLYQADNFPAGRNEHRRMPPVTRDSQGFHIFHRASTSPISRAIDAANPVTGQKS